MGSFGNIWARSHIKAQAIGTAVFLMGIVIYWQLADVPQRVSIERAEGQLVEVIRSEKGRPDPSVTFGRVRLEDGRILRLALPQPIPREGAQLVLRVEVYDDGSRIYFVDPDALFDNL